MSSEDLNIENKKVTIILYIFTYLSEEMFFFPEDNIGGK